MNVNYESSLLFIFFLADTLTMNNSFSKKDRMCSDRKTGSCDRQKKNEAKQHGGVSSPLDFVLIYVQSSMTGAHSRNSISALRLKMRTSFQVQHMETSFTTLFPQHVFISSSIHSITTDQESSLCVRLSDGYERLSTAWFLEII